MNNLTEYLQKNNKVMNPFVHEEWKPLLALDIDPTLYQISNTGKVYMNDAQRLMVLSENHGYMRGHFRTVSGEYKMYDMHRLMMIIFNPIPNRQNYVVNHIDGDKSNNTINNLEWCTQKENIQHSIDTGMTRIGTDKVESYMTDSQIHFICKSFEECKTYDYIITELMKQGDYEYEKLRGLLSNIKQHKTYRHISSLYNIDNKHHNSIYSEEFVHTLCRYLSEGNHSADELMSIMNIPAEDRTKFRTLIRYLLDGTSFTEVASRYNLKRPKDMLEKPERFSQETVLQICKYIQAGLSYDEILAKLYNEDKSEEEVKLIKKSIYHIKTKVLPRLMEQNKL